MWQVIFFELPSGRCPVKDFLNDLNEVKDLPYIDHGFERLRKSGNNLPRQHADYLRDKIYELRVKTRNGQFRFLFFFDKNIICITHGFKKKTRKVPNRQIDLAIKYKNIYFEGDEK